MATQAQIRANRRNAQKSTGPNTRIGKATSAFNARKHGLSARLDGASVTEWYRVIVDDAAARPNPSESGERLQAARWLAEAEARLEKVWREEEVFLLDPDPGGVDAKNVEDIEDDIDMLEEAAYDHGWDSQGLRLLARAEKFNLRQKINAANRRNKKTRLLSRYRAEAEAQRNKALKHWIDVGFDMQIS
jgi:hypothetical protein